MELLDYETFNYQLNTVVMRCIPQETMSFGYYLRQSGQTRRKWLVVQFCISNWLLIEVFFFLLSSRMGLEWAIQPKLFVHGYELIPAISETVMMAVSIGQYRFAHWSTGMANEISMFLRFIEFCSGLGDEIFFPLTGPLRWLEVSQ